MVHMTTKKPRITVTLEPRVYEVLRSISENGGGPMSSFISSLLDENLPTFERMALLFQKFAEQKGALASDLEEAQEALAPLAEKALAQLDMFLERRP